MPTEARHGEASVRPSEAKESMNAPLVGALATAGVLGVTHAIEPDHVAGIAALTGREGDTRLSALAGACFSLGHVALVVVWLAIGYLLLGRTSFPPIYDTVGTVGVGLALGVLGTVMAVGGLRSVVHTHKHDYGDGTHTHAHLHLAGFDRPAFGTVHDHPNDGDGHTETGDHAADTTNHADADCVSDSTRPSSPVDRHRTGSTHDHGHGGASYLKTGLVGALFTLSPPLSMIAFGSTLFPRYGTTAVGLAVVAYTAAITATMSAIGAGVGVAAGTAIGTPRAYGVARAAGGVLIVGFAVSMLATVVSIPL